MTARSYPWFTDVMTNDDIVSKIQALLAKAEGGTTPEEAEALIGKAQQLMARHAIDEAMLRRTDHTGEQPTAVELKIDAPYASQKTSLLNVISKTNGVRAVLLSGRGGTVWLGGFPSDIERVKAMFSSLLIVGQSAMVRERAAHPEVHGRSFASSFWHAFALRIGVRLTAATEAAEADAEAEQGHSVALALVDRKGAVDALAAERFERGLVTRKTRFSLNAGATAGDRAGRSANLSSSLGGGRATLCR